MTEKHYGMTIKSHNVNTILVFYKGQLQEKYLTRTAIKLSCDGPDFSISKGVRLYLIFGCDNPTYNPSHEH